MTDLPLETIASLYRDDGLTYAEIRERTGISNRKISNALTAHNVERRPQHRLVGRPNTKPLVIVKRQLRKVNNRRVDCARCGLLLAEAPGRVAELCAICCEELIRGVVYDEPREKVVAWVEQLREVVA